MYSTSPLPISVLLSSVQPSSSISCVVLHVHCTWKHLSPLLLANGKQKKSRKKYVSCYPLSFTAYRKILFTLYLQLLHCPFLSSYLFLLCHHLICPFLQHYLFSACLLSYFLVSFRKKQNNRQKWKTIGKWISKIFGTLLWVSIVFTAYMCVCCSHCSSMCFWGKKALSHAYLSTVFDAILC